MAASQQDAFISKDALQKMPEYKYQKRNGTSG